MQARPWGFMFRRVRAGHQRGVLPLRAVLNNRAALLRLLTVATTDVLAGHCLQHCRIGGAELHFPLVASDGRFAIYDQLIGCLGERLVAALQLLAHRALDRIPHRLQQLRRAHRQRDAGLLHLVLEAGDGPLHLRGRVLAEVADEIRGTPTGLRNMRQTLVVVLLRGARLG